MSPHVMAHDCNTLAYTVFNFWKPVIALVVNKLWGCVIMRYYPTKNIQNKGKHRENHSLGEFRILNLNMLHIKKV